jgi:hypothetical protein
MTILKKCAATLIGVLATCSLAFANETADLDGEQNLITSGDPENPLYANAGANLRNGVGSIFIEFDGIPVGGFLCTATVIDDHHILTAAHCVRNAGDTVKRLRLVLFAGLPAPMILDATGFSVNSLYDLTNPGFGAFAAGDVAIIELPNALPPEIERYGLYRTADEFGETTRHYGHGRSGKGNKGATGDSDFFFARTGLNMYEQTLGAFFGPPFDQLLHDYDSGGENHNAMDWWFSSFMCSPDNPNPPFAQDGKCTTFRAGIYPDRGFDKLEVGIASGDSGGPGFIDGRIAGVHSFGFTYFCGGAGSPTNGPDFTCGLDSSYGEMSGDTRVSTYADWIDGVVAKGTDTTIPELAPAPAKKARGGKKAAADGQEDAAELSDLGRAFMALANSQTPSKKMTFDEALELLERK